jgi:hypothetical protein
MMPNIAPIANVNNGYTLFSNTACGLDVKMAMKKKCGNKSIDYAKT